MFWMRAYPLRGQVGGSWALWNGIEPIGECHSWPKNSRRWGRCHPTVPLKVRKVIHRSILDDSFCGLYTQWRHGVQSLSRVRLTLNDICPFFLLLFLPLDAALFMLTQPSWDGYFTLFSSKRSIRGTVKRKAIYEWYHSLFCMKSSIDWVGDWMKVAEMFSWSWQSKENKSGSKDEKNQKIIHNYNCILF